MVMFVGVNLETESIIFTQILGKIKSFTELYTIKIFSTLVLL